MLSKAEQKVEALQLVRRSKQRLEFEWIQEWIAVPFFDERRWQKSIRFVAVAVQVYLHLYNFVVGVQGQGEFEVLEGGRLRRKHK